MAEQPPKTAPRRMIAKHPPTQQPKTPPKAAPMRIRKPPPPEPVVACPDAASEDLDHDGGFRAE